MFFDSVRFIKAGVRFQQTVGAKHQKQPVHITERSRYLAQNLARTKAKMLCEAAVAAGAPDEYEHTVDQLSQERIIGSSDLLDINYLELAIALGRAVARIQIGNEFGTGFLIGPGLAMTNHHVIGNENDGQQAIFQFDYQDNSSGDLLPRQDFQAQPASFFLTDPDLDFTVVGIGNASNKGVKLDAYPWIKLIGSTGKAEKGDPLNIIQHPRGGLKQIAFRKNEVIEIPDGKKQFLYYTTDTEPGSSGSPCFNDQWELVALHHSGTPALNKDKKMLRKDGQVWRKGIDPEELIAWIGNEGARISAIVAAMRAATLKPEWADLRDRALEAAPPNPIELSRSITPVADSKEDATNTATTTHKIGDLMNQTYTWTVPIQISVSVGGSPGTATAVNAPQPQKKDIHVTATNSATNGALEVTIDPDWSKRKGFDPNFLGVNISVPKLSAAQKTNSVDVPPQYRKNGDKYLLNYFHYSVAMNKARRTAWFSAGMIDGTHFQDFKRGKDSWFLDPRIDTRFQMGEELYAAARTDRGHLTRFKDLSWGASMSEAVSATNDSFHFTNCTLQLDGFNEGKDRWQGLEQFLLEQHAKKDSRKMIVITGPVLLDTDPLYHNPSMGYSTRIPLAFWKVCCLRRQDNSISATGFKLGQEDITKLPGFEEKFNVGITQLAIADLEKLTGLDFGVLTTHDHFADGRDPGTLEIARIGGGKRKIKPIENYEDIVV